MSWFSDLAKGAEALLEKVDQSTASALQKEKDASNASNPSFSVSEIPDGKESMPDIHPQTSTDLRQGTVQQMPGKICSNQQLQIPVTSLKCSLLCLALTICVESCLD